MALKLYLEHLKRHRKTNSKREVSASRVMQAYFDDAVICRHFSFSRSPFTVKNIPIDFGLLGYIKTEKFTTNA